MSAREDPRAAEEYRETISIYFDCRLAAPPDDFFNIAEFYHLGAPLLGRARSIAQRFTRSRASARRGGVDHLKVVLQQSGTMRATYGEREIVCRPGSIRFLDMAKPYDSHMEPYDYIDLVIPRDALTNIVPDGDIHGLVLEPGKPGGAMLAAHIQTLWQEAGRMTIAEARASADAALMLIGGAVSGRVVANGDHRAAIDRTLIAQARRYIDAQLANPALGPETLGAHLGLSQRSLYRLFEPEGGVAAFIRARRLDRAFHAVLARGRTLGEVAYGHGFQSNAHFTRAFTARFGVLPSDLRAHGRMVDPDAAPSGQAGFDTISRWLQAL